MIRVRECETLDALIGAFQEARQGWETAPWSRGHEVENWELKPSVWREFGHRPLAEMNSFANFRNDAISIRAGCPAFDDALGWLMLMQHFDLPTRLLDWSRSLSVAGYFCAFNEKHFDQDGAIWLLHPGRLNRYLAQKTTPSVALLDDVGVINLAQSASMGGPFLDQAFAVLTPQTNERIMQQRGVFTIHGGPQPLEQRASADEYLMKVIIPKTSKPAIADALGCLGVSRSTLFPDIGTLGKVIKESIKMGIELGHWGDEV